MIWRQLRRAVLQSISGGCTPTRILMRPKYFEDFVREQRMMKSYDPTDPKTGKELDLVPKSLHFSTPGLPKGETLQIFLKVTDKAPETTFRLDFSPLILNPVTSKFE